MSEPKRAEAVKLIASVLFSEKTVLEESLGSLCSRYGLPDFISPSLSFSYTDYYCPEMGDGLKRRFLSFKELIRPESLADVKLSTNEMEGMLSVAGRRRVNIDPGYVARAHLLLATGKGYSHRPYLREGIYVDLALIYSKTSFGPLPWTYPDYREGRTIAMFNKIREKYILQLKRNGADK